MGMTLTRFTACGEQDGWAGHAESRAASWNGSGINPSCRQPSLDQTTIDRCCLNSFDGLWGWPSIMVTCVGRLAALLILAGVLLPSLRERKLRIPKPLKDPFALPES